MCVYFILLLKNYFLGTLYVPGILTLPKCKINFTKL